MARPTEWAAGWRGGGRLAVGVALVLLPAVVTYALLASLRSAVPMLDDFPLLLLFALRFTKAQGVGERLHLLLAGQGPYKLVFAHALVALQLLVAGHISFLWLVWAGNLTLLGTMWVWCQHTVPTEVEGRWRVLYCAPVALLLFGLNYAEDVNWALGSLQQLAVIPYALLSLHLLVRPRVSGWMVAGAGGMAAVASATNANGMLVWPVGLLFLLVARRPAWAVGSWCGMFGATALVYVQGVAAGGLSPSGSIGRAVLFFVMFCGGAVENMHHRPVPYAAVGLGLAILGVFGSAVWRGFAWRNPFALYAAVWLLLTGAVVANGRVGMGLTMSLSSRYKVFCDLLLIFCYVYGLDCAARRPGGARSCRRYLVVTSIAAVLFYGAAEVAGVQFLRVRRERAEAAMERYRASPGTESPMFLVEETLNASERAEEAAARGEMNEARQLGIYRLPSR